MAKYVNLTSKIFGRLKVIEDAGIGFEGGRSKRFWTCLCSCGNLTKKSTNSLNSGKVRSCGCLAREGQSSRAIIRNTKHGHNKSGRGNQSPTWHSWNSMKKRCLYEKHVSFPNYGGRGIKICDRWINSFSNFLQDMGERPDGKTLDRIDVNGDYSPENCKWSTPSEQQKNKRRSK